MHIDAFALTSILLTVAALLAFVNRRFIGLPSTIGVMALALLASLAMAGIGSVSPAFIDGVRHLLEEVNFSDALLDVMLAFLLFTGALHVKLEDLAGEKWTIGALATVGVMISTALVGVLTKLFFVAIGACLGALTHWLIRQIDDDLGWITRERDRPVRPNHAVARLTGE